MELTMTGRARSSDAPSCVLRIEELVLHGFHTADRHVIAEAIANELGRLLGEAGAQQALRGRAPGDGDHRLDAGSFMVPADATPHALGVQVARAIHRGLAGPRSRAPIGSPAVPAPSAPGGTR
jgi:hypothetical protein